MIEVLRPGLLTSVQDGGRATRRLGVVQSGALDTGALRLANALVGNPVGAAALEISGQGPVLRVHADVVLAWWGAPFQARLNGQPLPPGRAVHVRAGSLLDMGSTSVLWRAVLAFRGGVQAQPLLGSRSTDLQADFGGFKGRALKRGDVLNMGDSEPGRPSSLSLSASLLPAPRRWAGLRVLPTGEGQADLLYGRSFIASQQANRMGLRLSGGVNTTPDPMRLSLPNVVGAVQLPPDGAPIILLADAGTHGGYPTPIVVIAADHNRLAQLRPGDSLRFIPVSLAEAERLWQARELSLHRIEMLLRWHWDRALA